jgi:hypothetical protein
MATNNRITGSENESFKQIESDSWTSVYLPAICAGIIMTIVLFVAIACSRKSETSADRISPPTQPAVASPAPTTASAPLSAAPKKVKKHRPANATYVNGTYGVSFSYPRKYSLAAGNAKAAIPVKPSFLKPGAVEVASVDVPDTSYPDTDFSSALLNVSVNPGMTADECGQFTPYAPYSKDAEVAKPSTIKLGTNEFTVLEQMSGEMTHQSDLKYFHLFKNGACYEFALDVETSHKADEELAQVDRGQVFKQLEKMLTSARIKDAEIAGAEKAETAVVDRKSTGATVTNDAKNEAKSQTESMPDTSSNMEKAQVVTPEQK